METILLVEDNDDVRLLIREMLRRRGFTVIDARNGREAVTLAERHAGPIDVLITDVVMPSMSGPQLADLLTLTRPEMHTLYISGYLDDQLAEHGLSYTEPNFLQKPFTQDELIEKLQEVLQTGHAAGQAALPGAA